MLTITSGAPTAHDLPAPGTPPRLVIIPGGPARIGCADGFADEGPPHWVDVPPFAIGIAPVTNYDYAAFLAARHLPAPPYWYDPRLSQPAQPIVGVTWRDAVAYCAWLTLRLRAAGQLALDCLVRLPTEIEWEKAASWDPVHQVQRRYPWGDTWDATRAVTAASDTAFPLPIGEHPRSASAYGVQHMLGNVWEWTASRYVSYPRSAAPFAEPQHYVLRGGSCALRPTHLRCSFRCRLPPHAWRYHLGFRIVVAEPLG
jgi:formylglycine-generating enzyme required for sulfatase activity